MRGRKRQPTQLKLVKGNPGKRPLNEREPKPRRVIPSPPAHLTDEARVHWGRFSLLLDRMGVLTEADAAALEQVCLLYQEMIELRQVVREKGRFYVTTNKDDNEMIRPHPAVAMVADCDRRFRGYLAEFGLTPAARSRVVGEMDGVSSDPAEAYF
jgi:P27 family predicted phage terminase small subunit